MLTYLELIDSRGWVNTKSVPVKEDLLILLAAVASVDADGDEDADELYDLLEEPELAKFEDKVYAFGSFITGDHQDTAKARARYWKRVWKALDEKGFYADMWEEGSYAICRDGFKKQAVNAIARIEARVAADNWDF
jgi:hypothetical protein